MTFLWILIPRSPLPRPPVGPPRSCMCKDRSSASIFDQDEDEDESGHNGEDHMKEGGDAVAKKAGAEIFRAGTVVYISGEENNSQVAARAAR